MRVEESIEIGRPRKEVFDYVSEPDNFPEWTGTAIEVRKGAPGPVREGDTFTAVIKFLGRRFETPYERTAKNAAGTGGFRLGEEGSPAQAAARVRRLRRCWPRPISLASSERALA